MTVGRMATRGDWLKSHMDRRQISVRRLADALGVTSKTVYDWRDDRTAISEERVPRLAEVLEVSEIEARRGLGFWVPDEGVAEPSSREAGEIDVALEIMRSAIAELERIKRDRNAG
jgi:transcriptional regulator with XRE-family HTH domain